MRRNRDKATATVAIEDLFEAGTLTSLGDEELLLRFRVQSDTRALESLVHRYGPLVLSVCREILADPNDVDDAFQATFLILIRKSGSIRRPGSLAAWLHGVAYRVAVRTKRTSRPPSLTEEPAAPEAACVIAEREQHELLHRELERLPEKFRLPIVLCYFQGLTQEDAASRLRWPLGTVRGRLARARDRLRDRLSRHEAGLAVGFTRNLESLCNKRIAITNTQAQSILRLLESTVPSRVAALSQGVLVAMIMGKLKWVLLTLITTSIVSLAARSSMLALAAPGRENAEPVPIAETEQEEPQKAVVPISNVISAVDLSDEARSDELDKKKVQAEMLEMETDLLKHSIESLSAFLESNDGPERDSNISKEEKERWEIMRTDVIQEIIRACKKHSTRSGLHLPD